MDTQTTPPSGVEAPATPAAVKPGYKTTEFWLSAGATAAGLLISSGIVPTEGIWPKIVALVVAAFAAMGYTVQRTNLKVQ